MVVQALVASVMFIISHPVLHAAATKPSAPITIQAKAAPHQKPITKPSPSPTKFTFNNSPEALRTFTSALSSSPHVKKVNSSPRKVSFTVDGCDQYTATQYCDTSDTEAKQIEQPAYAVTTSNFVLKAADFIESHYGKGTKSNIAAAAALIKRADIEPQYKKLVAENGDFVANDYLERQVKELLHQVKPNTKLANNNTTTASNG